MVIRMIFYNNNCSLDRKVIFQGKNSMLIPMIPPLGPWRWLRETGYILYYNCFVYCNASIKPAVYISWTLYIPYRVKARKRGRQRQREWDTAVYISWTIYIPYRVEARQRDIYIYIYIYLYTADNPSLAVKILNITPRPILPSKKGLVENGQW